MKKTGGGGGKGHTSKHVGSGKHHAHTSKHHPKHHVKPHGHAGAPVHVKAKHPHHGRGLAIGDLLPVCTLEAVAMSLRLAGQPVSDEEVAWLWEATTDGRELSIGEALEAAARFGLAGFRPQWYATNDQMALPVPVRMTAIDHRMAARSWESMPLILGVDVPGPHAVLATPDGWWSWGELWTPWTTAVSEAWAVSWS